jgi:hypothetical protein
MFFFRESGTVGELEQVLVAMFNHCLDPLCRQPPAFFNVELDFLAFCFCLLSGSLFCRNGSPGLFSDWVLCSDGSSDGLLLSLFAGLVVLRHG